MFAKSRKEQFVERAQDLARDVSEAIAPHVERARDELAPRVAGARDQVAPHLSDAREQLSAARDQLAPRVADVRDEIAPRLADAREQLTPHVEEVRDRIAKGVATASAAAAPVALEARRRGELATAALKGEPVKRKGGKKKYVLFAGLLGLGALAVQKLRGGSESTNWQTSYTPPASPPAPPAPPPSPSAPMSGSHAAEGTSEAEASDPVGATPGESLADAVEEPHPVTTPDAPAENVTSVQDPGKS